METGPPRYNPNDVAAQPKVIPPPIMPGGGGNIIGAQPAVVPGNNIPPPPLPSSLPPLMKLLSYILRGLPILLTFLATVLMGAAKYTEKYTYKYPEAYTELKATDFSALVYFTVVNALVCAYSVASLVISLVMKAKAMTLEMVIFVADLLVVTFLLTSNGAASTISVLLDDDGKSFALGACGLLKGFCSQIQAAIAFSMIASVAYLVLIFLRIFVPHK